MELKKAKAEKISRQIEHYRSKLIPYAYNIIGDYMEAEDVVHEVLNRFFLDTGLSIEKPDQYLKRAVINRSINQKKLLRKQLEKYPGEWLPSPVATAPDMPSPIERKHLLDYALLVTLERLNSKQRAVFILKEAFDYPHQEIADILDISIDNSRQLLKRSKEKIATKQTAVEAISVKDYSKVADLAEAIMEGEMKVVTRLLSDEVRSISDGGPKQSAARNIITGKERVYKLMKAVYGKYMPDNACSIITSVNHQPAILYHLNGLVFRCIVFEISSNKVQNIYIIINPDKLSEVNNSV